MNNSLEANTDCNPERILLVKADPTLLAFKKTMDFFESELQAQEKWQDSTGWFVATDERSRTDRSRVISNLLDSAGV